MNSRFTRIEQKFLAISPMLTGFISFLSSLTMITMILKSKKKLTNSYRRFIFGLSWACAVFSFGNMFSTIPVYSSDIWGAMGTVEICEAQGFFVYVGLISTAIYNMSLCILFVCTINFGVDRCTFAKKIEPFLHLFQFSFSLTWGIYLLNSDQINPGQDSLLCWIAPFPSGCHFNEDLDCIRGETAYAHRWYAIGIPVACAFSVIVISLFLITRKVKKQQSINRKYRFGLSSRWCEFKDRSNQEIPRQKKLEKLQRIKKSRKELEKEKAVTEQAIVNILAFTLNWLFPFVNSLLEKRMSNGISFYQRLLGRTLMSMQGVLNMLVYTRPHLISLRSLHPEYSWLKAFIIVVKSGGDNDGNLPKKRRLSRISLNNIHSPRALGIKDSLSGTQETEEIQKIENK